MFTNDECETILNKTLKPEGNKQNKKTFWTKLDKITLSIGFEFTHWPIHKVPGDPAGIRTRIAGVGAEYKIWTYILDC